MWSVLLVLQGRQTLAVTATVGRSRAFVQRWAYAYRDGGIEAVRGRTPPGRRRRLSTEQETRFVQRVKAGGTSRDGVASPPFVNRVRASRPRTKVRVWFQDEARFGQQGTLTAVWAIKGSRPTVVRQNGRKSIWVFAAVEPATGWSLAMPFRDGKTETMQSVLDAAANKRRRRK